MAVGYNGRVSISIVTGPPYLLAGSVERPRGGAHRHNVVSGVREHVIPVLWQSVVRASIKPASDQRSVSLPYPKKRITHPFLFDDESIHLVFTS